jgi:hypothetical protein
MTDTNPVQSNYCELTLEKPIKAEDIVRVSPLDASTKSKGSKIGGYLGSHHIVQDQRTQAQLTLKEVIYSSEEDFIKGVASARNKLNVRDDGLLNLIDYSASVEKNFCSTLYKVRLYFVPHLNDLAKATKQARKDNKGCTEQSLVFLLFHLTNGLAELNKSGFTHKNISPEAVDTTSIDSNNPKLIHLEDESQGNLRTISFNNIMKGSELYLAPEVFSKMGSLTKSSAKLDFQEDKVDAFALGMLLLSTGLNKSVNDCYDTKKQVFDVEKLDGYRKEFNENFRENPMICESVERLLDLNPESRYSAVQLQSDLASADEIYEYFGLTPEGNKIDYDQLVVQPQGGFAPIPQEKRVQGAQANPEGAVHNEASNGNQFDEMAPIGSTPLSKISQSQPNQVFDSLPANGLSSGETWTPAPAPISSNRVSNYTPVHTQAPIQTSTVNPQTFLNRAATSLVRNYSPVKTQAPVVTTVYNPPQTEQRSLPRSYSQPSKLGIFNGSHVSSLAPGTFLYEIKAGTQPLVSQAAPVERTTSHYAPILTDSNYAPLKTRAVSQSYSSLPKPTSSLTTSHYTPVTYTTSNSPYIPTVIRDGLRSSEYVRSTPYTSNPVVTYQTSQQPSQRQSNYTTTYTNAPGLRSSEYVTSASRTPTSTYIREGVTRSRAPEGDQGLLPPNFLNAVTNTPSIRGSHYTVHNTGIPVTNSTSYYNRAQVGSTSQVNFPFNPSSITRTVVNAPYSPYKPYTNTHLHPSTYSTTSIARAPVIVNRAAPGDYRTAYTPVKSYISNPYQNNTPVITESRVVPRTSEKKPELQTETKVQGTEETERKERVEVPDSDIKAPRELQGEGEITNEFA